MKPVLVITGPTCVGKTSVALAVAKEIENPALINADSRQMFSGLHAGTACPTATELAGTRAELFAVVPPGGDVSLAAWLAAVRRVIEQLALDGGQPVLVGGTGLFVTAFSEGYELGEADIDPKRREQLNHLASTPEGLAALRAALLDRSPAFAATVDMANPRRVVRATEKLEAGIDRAPAHGQVPDCLVICIDAERALHRRLIESRAQSMFLDDALIEEAKACLANGVSPEALRRCGIGYPEAMDVIAGKLTRPQAIDAVTKRTVAYANVQRTWFRHHRVDHFVHRGEGLIGPVVAETRQLWANVFS